MAINSSIVFSVKPKSRMKKVWRGFKLLVCLTDEVTNEKRTKELRKTTLTLTEKTEKPKKQY